MNRAQHPHAAGETGHWQNEVLSGADAAPKPFSHRVLIAVGLALAVTGLVLLAGFGFQVLLLVLAGVLVAVLFRGLADWVSSVTHLGKGVSLVVAVAGVLLLLTGLVWLLAPQVSQQVQQMSQYLPKAVEQVRTQVQHIPWVSTALGETSALQNGLSLGKGSWLKRGFGVLSGVLGVFADLYVILFVGLFLMAQPSLYKKGLIALFPIRHRHRATQVLDTLGNTLFRWLLGKMASMALVGVLTTVGLLLLNIPMAFALGVFAALASFVPNFGPIVALVPASLIAFSQGSSQVLYVIALYVGVQAVESNVLTPLIQKKMVRIPPALIIIGQVLLGVFTGTLGLILATPLVAMLMVLVKMLYVHDTLGDTSVQVEK